MSGGGGSGGGWRRPRRRRRRRGVTWRWSGRSGRLRVAGCRCRRRRLFGSTEPDRQQHTDTVLYQSRSRAPPPPPTRGTKLLNVSNCLELVLCINYNIRPYIVIYTVFQKGNTKLTAITLLILNRFSKLFHCQILQQIFSKVFIRDPTAPHTRRYTTL